MKHGANVFSDSSAPAERDPLRYCKAGQHVAKIANKATGERICIVCKKTLTQENKKTV